MSAKHTPGPFTFSRTTGEILDATGRVIGSVHGDSDREEGELGYQFAAAPDLLAILQDLADPESGCRLTSHALTNARAAIAKATGGDK